MSTLAPISENDTSLAVDQKTAIDPFENYSHGFSPLAGRFKACTPVEYNPPIIRPKEERIDDEISSWETEPPQETVTPEYTEFLQYVDNFLIQFYKDNPYRMRVFLTAENEYGTRYFLSSYIRPYVLPLIEAHTVGLAAEFVANLCNYQILFDFFTQPRCITTPNFTVKSQIGDCYDLSVLLTTILAGIGYDAYVVVGYANREITMADLRYRPCPGVAYVDEHIEANTGPVNKYLKKVQGRQLNLASNFEAQKQNPPPPPPPPIVPLIPPVDEYEGRRMHAWVLVKSYRVELPDGQSAVFIDPATGDQYPIDSPLFGNIELMFNHNNVWIRNDPTLTRNEDTMNVENPDYWKPVIDGTVKLPSPVVDKLAVPDTYIFQKYPKGEKRLLWSDALEERYAPYTKPDGLVRRYFIYQRDLDNIREIREYFYSLRQRLVERRVYFNEQEMIEKFESGHESFVKTHKICHGKSRLLEFEPGKRLDCLVSRLEVFGEKIVEKYGPRNDGLCERKIEIVPDSSTTTSQQTLYKGGPKIRRMTQKYLHPSKVIPSETTHFAVTNSVYKVAFDIVNGTMQIIYHHQSGRITNFSIEYRRDREKEKEFTPYPTRLDPNPPEYDNWYLTETQNQLIKIREEGLADAEKIAVEMVQWIQFRTEEEQQPFLKMKSVDVVLHRKLFSEMENADPSQGPIVKVEQPPPELKPEGEEDASNAQQQLNASDPLCVYFPINQVEMNEAEALAVVKRATTALNSRMLEEYQMLKNRLQQEMQLMKKKNNEFEMDQHQSMSKKQSDEHDEFNAKQTFLIKVIQKRIARFKETAVRRLFDLNMALKNHPKLAPYLKNPDGEVNVTYDEVRARMESVFPSEQ